MPMPFRYQVGPTEVMKTSCFRPNPIGPNFDPEKHKPSTLGAVYMGQNEQGPKAGYQQEGGPCLGGWVFSSKLIVSCGGRVFSNCRSFHGID